ncbi:MAG: heavy metal-binding domain-containing protein [Polyangiales bacterium]
MTDCCKHHEQANADQQVPSGPSAIYACPMHSDIRSSEPGTCAVCGMTMQLTLAPTAANSSTD